MPVKILNRDFQHPADGWYNIEAKGRHPNARAGLVQVIDDEACQSIVKKFNAAAAQPGFAGMLIDHEHFKHDDDKETLAYGWLMQLQHRSDGIYGRIRWTGTGQKSVDDGDYRFFSTEYDPAKMTVLNTPSPGSGAAGKGRVKEVRPLELAGLTLTNVNNNKGQKPITNRDMKKDSEETPSETQGDAGEALAASKKANDASKDANSARQHEQAAVLHRKAEKLCENCGNDKTAAYHGDMAEHHDATADGIRNGVNNRQFPPGSAGSDRPQDLNTKEQMKTVAEKLGLPADASEPTILAEVTKILNRKTELESQVVEADLKQYEDRIDPSQKEFVKNMLVTNREKTIEFLKSAPKRATSPERVTNRGDRQEPEGDPLNKRTDFSTEIADEVAKLRAGNSKLTHLAAREIVRNRKPEWFGLPPREKQKAA